MLTLILEPQNIDHHLKQLNAQVIILASKVKEAEKEIHSSIVKFGKGIDKTFKTDFSSLYASNDFNMEPSSDLNKALLLHLARMGQFDLASIFKNETHISVSTEILNEFAIMYQIVEALKNENLEPAIEWASLKRSTLFERGSDLEFTLHKVQFIRILLDDQNPLKALSYAQKHLPKFSDRHLGEISELMSSLIYYKNLKASPNPEIFKLPTYEKLSWLFSAEFCLLIGLSPESPIYLAALSGTLALPVLAKIEALIKTRKAEWTTKNELPTEIDLPESLIFHQIFVCPVSKEQTTDENPPKLLPCGHIISELSLESMKKDNVTGKKKCPYCPCTTSLSETKRVYF